MWMNTTFRDAQDKNMTLEKIVKQDRATVTIFCFNRFFSGFTVSQIDHLRLNGTVSKAV